jgi:carbon-monoxide dehydrogenase iron sulfur subunit
MTHCITQDPVTRAVMLDSSRCVGCWMCSMVCPYDAITHDAEHQVARKCDLCVERDLPACVVACPTQALMWVEPAGSFISPSSFER